MLRRRTLLVAALTLVVGANRLCGQELLLLATDAAGNATPRARAIAVPDRAPDVPILRDVLPLPTALEATADARGLVRVRLDRPALVLLATDEGLGAIVARAFPDRAVRVALQPMASLRLPAASEVHAAVVDAATSERRRLPPLHVDADGRLRLPHGSYEIWWHSDRAVGWSTCEAKSGQEVTLDESSPTLQRELAAFPGRSRLRPRGAFDLVLDTDPDHALVLQQQAAAGDFFVEDATTGALRVVTTAASPRKPLVVRVEAADSAMAFVLEPTASRTFRVVAGARVANGLADLVAPEGDGDHWLVVTEPGQAARAVRLRELVADRPLPRRPARTLACTVRDASGEPVPFAAVQFAVEADGPTVAIAFTDALGHATLGPVTGSGLALVDDPRFLPASVAVGTEESLDLAFALEPGAELHGRAVFADGRPARNAAVSVRAPDGSQGLAERAVPSGDDGSFAFSGLDPRARLVVFATATRDGHTWSARATVRAGAGSIELVLRDEDPQLGPPRERR